MLALRVDSVISEIEASMESFNEVNRRLEALLGGVIQGTFGARNKQELYSKDELLSLKNLVGDYSAITANFSNYKRGNLYYVFTCKHVERITATVMELISVSETFKRMATQIVLYPPSHRD